MAIATSRCGVSAMRSKCACTGTEEGNSIIAQRQPNGQQQSRTHCLKASAFITPPARNRVARPVKQQSARREWPGRAPYQSDEATADQSSGRSAL
eukprot:7242235-Prymnesium_polylepis.1